jgi:hypothetical protein
MKFGEPFVHIEKRVGKKKLTEMIEVKQEIATVSTKRKKDPKWQTWFPFTFFYGNGKLQPIYSFVSLFSGLGAWMLYIKIHAASIAIKNGTFTSDMLSTADLTVVLGFVSSLILLYNTGKKKTNGPSDNDSGPMQGN